MQDSPEAEQRPQLPPFGQVAIRQALVSEKRVFHPKPCQFGTTKSCIQKQENPHLIPIPG